MQQDTSTAYFSDIDEAQQAVRELRDAGVPGDEIRLENGSSSGSSGGFMESLKEFFGAEPDRQRYGSGAVLTVTGSRELAAPILRRYRARFEGSEGYDDTIGSREDMVATDTDTKRMALREERLSIDKQRVKTGEVHLGKDVIEEEQVIDVPVTREEVRVTRTPVNEGDYTGDVGEIGDGEDVSVPVTREEVNVQKRAVVTEEVGLEKRSVQDTERVGATVRKERARIETDGDADAVDDERS